MKDKPEPVPLADTADAVSRAPEPSSMGERSHSPAESATLVAPPFRSLARNCRIKSQDRLAGLPQPGERLGDFELLGVLGAGSFAKVYLARQVSLGRQVALKVAAPRGREAQTLACLEHEHIVRVFSETLDPERNLRLLCMQHVSGTTLENIIDYLAAREPRTWSGQVILEAVDRLSTQPAALDPAALRDRETLENCDFVEAVCWLGVRLAEALAHAHSQGVLHRDIKPANILVNRYGRPLLADFNLAFDPQHLRGSAPEVFGGTLAYMSPEHLDAFDPDEAMRPALVDRRSDIYSLGVVLFELLTGRLPFERVPADARAGVVLRGLAADRRVGAPSPRQVRAMVPPVLDRVVRRCLEPWPDGRYQTATDLAEALAGCLAWRRAERELPAPGPLTRLTMRRPLALGVTLTLLPHVVAVLVNTAYTFLQIADRLAGPGQQMAFLWISLGYTGVFFPTTAATAIRLSRPVARTRRQLDAGAFLDDSAVTTVRRFALRFPLWCLALSCLGWLPGGLLVPLVLHWTAPPVSGAVFLHCLLAYTISGLIAVTYNMFAHQFLALRIQYPRLWVDGRRFGQLARQELAGMDRRLTFLQLLAVLLPLAGGAALLLGGNPEHYGTFRLLVIALMGLGMAGFGLALVLSNLFSQTLTALTGGNGSGRRGRT